MPIIRQLTDEHLFPKGRDEICRINYLRLFHKHHYKGWLPGSSSGLHLPVWFCHNQIAFHLFLKAPDFPVRQAHKQGKLAPYIEQNTKHLNWKLSFRIPDNLNSFSKSLHFHQMSTTLLALNQLLFCLKSFQNRWFSISLHLSGRQLKYKFLRFRNRHLQKTGTPGGWHLSG